MNGTSPSLDLQAKVLEDELTQQRRERDRQSAALAALEGLVHRSKGATAAAMKAAKDVTGSKTDELEQVFLGIEAKTVGELEVSLSRVTACVDLGRCAALQQGRHCCGNEGRQGRDGVQDG